MLPESYSILPPPNLVGHLYVWRNSLSSHLWYIYSPLHNVAEILYSLDRLSEAECLYRELIHRNPENYFYFDQLEKCLLLGEGRGGDFG